VKTGKTVVLKITLKDAAGNAVPGKAGSINLTASSGTFKTPVESPAIAGLYTAVVTAGPMAGDMTITATVDNAKIKASIKVVP
jgi:hypothetical protein